MGPAAHSGFMLGYVIGACIGNMIVIWIGCKIARLNFEGGGMLVAAGGMALANTYLPWFFALPVGALAYWFAALKMSDARDVSHIMGAFVTSYLFSLVVALVLIHETTALLHEASNLQSSKKSQVVSSDRGKSEVREIHEPGSLDELKEKLTPEERMAINKAVHSE